MTLGWDNPTADPTTTVLLRHGDTQLSPEHRFSGLRDHDGQTVLVVSHVTPIKIMLCRALGVPLGTLYRLYLGSACINEIQWHGRGFAAVHRVNDTSHLP